MHTTVNHSASEYVRLDGSLHVNSRACRFSLMKRAVSGAHRSIAKPICRATSRNGISNSTSAN